MNPTRQKLWLTIFVVTACGICDAQITQQSYKNLPSIRQLMTREEFSRAGLAKLSETETQTLDAWLQKFAASVANASSTAAVSPSEAIETYISGDFNGWDGETIWKMDNGQIWKQSSYAFHYHYAYHPKVVIYSVAGGWKMKVDGVNSEVAVKRIR